MKKLIIITLILMLLPTIAHTANNQRVVFSGEFSLNNEGTDADSAYLYIYRYDEVRDSALVTVEDRHLLDGCYSHQITVEQDSGSGWYGYWVFVETANSIRISDMATVILAPDTASLKADTTGTAESVADQVWLENLSLHNIYGTAAVHVLSLSGVQALALAPGEHEQTTTRIALSLTAITDDLFNGCLLNCRAGLNEGFTTRIIDYEAYSGDSGVVIVSPPLVLAATENQLFVITSADHAEGDTNQFTVEDIGDTVRIIINDSIPALLDSLLLKARHAQVDSLKDTVEDMSTRLLATGFSTHNETDIWDLTTDGHTGAGTFGQMLESCSTSVLAVRDTAQYLVSATGFSTLTTSDNIGINWADIDNKGATVDLSVTTIDAVDDVSGSVGSVAGNVTVGDFVSGVIDDDALGTISEIQTEAEDAIDAKFIFDGDSVIIDWSTGWFAAGSGLDSATTSRILGRKIWGEAVGAAGSTDSINATARHTVPDTTGLMHEDDTIGIAADVYAELIDGSNEDQFKADVSGLSTLADNDIRVALGDTLYNSRTDSILAVLATVAADVLDIAYYWGACDGCYYRLYPESGTSNKDSAIIIDPSLGVDSMVAKVVYLHGTDVQVVDTVYFYRDEPW